MTLYCHAKDVQCLLLEIDRVDALLPASIAFVTRPDTTKQKLVNSRRKMLFPITSIEGASFFVML
jgi:hypothetical protein